MVSSVSLGSFKNIGGRNVLTGAGGSGLDTENIINSLVEARSIPKTKIEDKISLNDKKLEAFTELNTLMSAFKDANNALRNVPGFGKEADNAFMYRNASVVSNTSVAGSTYVDVQAAPGAAVQSLSVSSITSLAKATKQSTSSFMVASAATSVVTSAYTPGFFKAGSVSVNGETLTLEEGDSLAQVAAKFNALSSNTNISASVVQVDEGNYRLTFTATATGTDAEFDLNPGSDAVPTDASGVFSMIGRSNLLTNGTFNTNISGWTNASQGTGSIAYSSNKMLLDGDGAGNEGFAQQAITTTIGQSYTVRATLADLTHSAYLRVGTGSDVTNGSNYDITNYEVTADGVASITFTATSTTTYITVSSDTNTTPIRLDDISVVANATTAYTTTQSASDAEFTMDGITFTRSSNTVDDVISGLTFELKQTTPLATTVDISISPDQEIVRSSVINFINTYNDLRMFYTRQTEVDPKTGKFTEDAVLASDSVFRNVLNTAGTQLNRIVSGVSESYDSLSKVGITLTDLPETTEQPFTRNILTIDESAFSTATASDFEDVQALFGFTYNSNNANFRVFSRTKDIDVSSFTLNINPGAETFTATVGVDTITLTATPLGAGGYTLTAPEGSALDGLTMIYASSATATVNVTASQGIADRLYNFLDDALKETTGLVDVQTQAIKDSTTRANEEITRIDRQIELYRESLIRQFGALESLLSSVNTLLTSLQAQSDARNNA